MKITLKDVYGILNYAEIDTSAPNIDAIIAILGGSDARMIESMKVSLHFLKQIVSIIPLEYYKVLTASGIYITKATKALELITTDKDLFEADYESQRSVLIFQALCEAGEYIELIAKSISELNKIDKSLINEEVLSELLNKQQHLLWTSDMLDVVRVFKSLCLISKRLATQATLLDLFYVYSKRVNCSSYGFAIKKLIEVQESLCTNPDESTSDSMITDVKDILISNRYHMSSTASIIGNLYTINFYHRKFLKANPELSSQYSYDFLTMARRLTDHVDDIGEIEKAFSTIIALGAFDLFTAEVLTAVFKSTIYAESFVIAIGQLHTANSAGFVVDSDVLKALLASHSKVSAVGRAFAALHRCSPNLATKENFFLLINAINKRSIMVSGLLEFIYRVNPSILSKKIFNVIVAHKEPYRITVALNVMHYLFPHKFSEQTIYRIISEDFLLNILVHVPNDMSELDKLIQCFAAIEFINIDALERYHALEESAKSELLVKIRDHRNLFYRMDIRYASRSLFVPVGCIEVAEIITVTGEPVDTRAICRSTFR